MFGGGKLECVPDELVIKTKEKLVGIVPVDVFEECRQYVGREGGRREGGGRREEGGREGGRREKGVCGNGEYIYIFFYFFRAVRDFLSGQPLIDFVESPYYWRFLQWKTLER